MYFHPILIGLYPVLIKLLGGPVSVDFEFNSELVMKRVAKTIMLMDAFAKIGDPQCELLLLRACTGVSKLCFVMRICMSTSCVQVSSTHFGQGIGAYWCCFGGRFRKLAMETCYITLYIWGTWCLQSTDLQTKLLQHTCVTYSGSIFDDALSVINSTMGTDILSNPSEIATPELIDIYFT